MRVPLATAYGDFVEPRQECRTALSHHPDGRVFPCANHLRHVPDYPTLAYCTVCTSYSLLLGSRCATIPPDCAIGRMGACEHVGLRCDIALLPPPSPRAPPETR